MSQPAKKRKPASPKSLAELRWKGRTATDRIAETAAARAARWPRCKFCGLTEQTGRHDIDLQTNSHYFEPKEK